MDIVMVGCKHPTGLHLDLRAPMTEGSAAPVLLKRVTVAGTAAIMRDRGPLHGGYALTPVPQDHWEAWLQQNKDSRLVRENIVFANTAAKAPGQAKDQESVEPMFKPVDPKGDKRLEAKPYSPKDDK